jgi:HSP20 family molecular chaperone IbpA
MLQIRIASAAMGAILILPFAAPRAIAAEHDGKHGPSPMPNPAEMSRDLQERMSKRFHHTWQELRNSMESKAREKSSIATAAMDVREQNDAYAIRISLPGRDIQATEVSLTDGGRLRILAPAADKLGRHEQTLALDGIAPGTSPAVERKPADHLIIIRVPKAPTPEKPAPETADVPAPKPLPDPADRWDREMIARMDRMCREMDEMFRQTFDHLSHQPGFQDLFDQSRFGSSVEAREENDQYIIRAYLPDRDAQNVTAVIEEERILKIDARAEETKEQQNGAAMLKRKSSYSQVITLPGPVVADQLKIERKKDMVIISVPKKTKV